MVVRGFQKGSIKMRKYVLLVVFVFLFMSSPFPRGCKVTAQVKVPDIKMFMLADDKGTIVLCNNESKTGYNLKGCKLSKGRTIDDLVNFVVKNSSTVGDPVYTNKELSEPIPAI